MKQEIADLRGTMIHQTQSPQMAEEKRRLRTQKGIRGIGLLTLLVGFVGGYLLRRPDENRYGLR
jgi:hypothetical protein